MKIHLKKKDWILIIIIICVAGLAFLAHEFIGGKGASQVTIKVNGEIEGTYSLSEDREIKINDGSNVLQIKNGKAKMIEPTARISCACIRKRYLRTMRASSACPTRWLSRWKAARTASMMR